MFPCLLILLIQWIHIYVTDYVLGIPSSLQIITHHYYFIIFTWGHFFHCFLEREEGREEEREREISMWGRNVDWLPPIRAHTGDRTHNPGCALTKNQTGNLLVMGRCSNQLSHTGQGQVMTCNQHHIPTGWQRISSLQYQSHFCWFLKLQFKVLPSLSYHVSHPGEISCSVSCALTEMYWHHTWMALL